MSKATFQKLLNTAVQHPGQGFLDKFWMFVQTIENSEELILEAMQEELVKQNWTALSFLVIAARKKPSHTYVPLLCSILDAANSQVPMCGALIEDVVELLSQIPDVRSIPSLSKAIDLNLPGDEDNHWLNRKVIRALEVMGTPPAIEVLKKALKSPWEEIREDAGFAIQYLERQEHL